jgi:hypothetical protein
VETSKRPDGEGVEEVEEGGEGEDIMGKSAMMVVRGQEGLGMKFKVLHHLVVICLLKWPSFSSHRSKALEPHLMTKWMSSVVCQCP